MSFLEIRNFGPINNLKIDADKNINIIIGPQASGKVQLEKFCFFAKKYVIIMLILFYRM